MAERLPHINHETPISIDDIQWQQEVYEQEFLTRTRLVMGLLSSGDTAIEYGIVDSTEPHTVTSTSVRALVPYPNAADPTKFDLRPGLAVTRAGFVIQLTLSRTAVAPATVDVGDQYVVFLEYQTEESSTYNTITKYNTATASRTTVVDENSLLSVVDLDDWSDAIQYPDSRKDNCVVVGVATMVNTLTGKRLSFDYTGTTYSYNRPWFSPVDIAHRSVVGTGVVTSNNAHGIGLNDVATGNLTLYQQLLEHGMVLSKDYSVSRVPGILCSQTIARTDWQQDDFSGTITGRLFGWYVRLAGYPIRMGLLIDSAAASITDEAVACFNLPRTNILVIDNNEFANWATDPPLEMIAYYTCAYASQPPIIDDSTRELTFDQISSTREIIVSDGLGITSIPNRTLDLSVLGSLPTWARVFMDGSGNYVLTPQCVVPLTRLSGVTLNANNVVNTSLIGTASIRVGLANAIAGLLLDVSVTINGTVAGVSDTETVQFTTNWVDPGIPSSTGARNNYAQGPGANAGQWLRTTKLFETVTSWTLNTNTASGPLAEIIIQSLPGFPNATALREYVPICDINWDGLKVFNLIDRRPVNKKIEVPKKQSPFQLAAKMLSPGGIITPDSGQVWMRSTYRKPNFEVTAEDMEDPHFGSLIGPSDDISNLGADHWAEGMGELCGVGEDIHRSLPEYLSRAFYVPHEGSYTPLSNYPTYDTCRLMIIQDDDPERHRDLFEGTPRGGTDLPTGWFRYCTRSDPRTWIGPNTLEVVTGGPSRYNNTWLLQAWDGQDLDYFYKFQIELGGPGVRGWVAYWEKLVDIPDQAFVGGWDMNMAGGPPLVYTDVLNNPLYTFVAINSVGFYEYQIDFTYNGAAPTSTQYSAWISGSLQGSVQPTDLFSIEKSLTIPGRFSVYEYQNPLNGNGSHFTIFIHVSHTL